MTIAQRGHIFLTGETLGRIAPGGEPQGDSDVFAVELDSRGRWIAAWQDGTNDDDSARAIAVHDAGRALVGGYTTGAMTSHTHLGRRDGFIVEAELVEIDGAVDALPHE